MTTGRRSTGGVVKVLMSRSSIIDMCSVRGMGVAVRTNTSANERSSRSRCAQRRPLFFVNDDVGQLKNHIFGKQPMGSYKTSTDLAVAFRTAWVSSRVRSSNPSTRREPGKRSRNDRRCCSAGTVVGTKQQPVARLHRFERPATHLVLPKPTSPQTDDP